MDRDETLRHIAGDFEFDVDASIQVGGKYVPLVVDESIVYVAGQIPRVGDEIRFPGMVGAEVSLADARRAAAISVLRTLSLIRHRFGTLDVITAVPRITVFVRSAPDFAQQSEVADGASDLLYSVLGDVGVHTRTSVGVLQLPKGACVEIDFIFKVTGAIVQATL